MSVAQTQRVKRIPAPELRGSNLALGTCRDREVCLEGPAGTGKTVAALFKIHTLLSRYPGSRALVARKTNTALSGSAMVTYRDNILKGRTDIRWFGGNKVEPAAYRYPNGSEMIVNGLDKPEKVQSSEFDWGYINETTECNLDDIEFVRIRLRPRTNGPKVPYRQLILDCNPGPPTHWLNQRMNKGITTRLHSRHEDNPRYWDAKTNDWTEEGREYVLGILEGLTGVRYLRLRKGIWAAAEGMVYESWDSTIHKVSKQQLLAWGILTEDDQLGKAVKEVVAAVDWGFTNPGYIGVVALDGDRRAFLIHEVYRTQRTDDWWVAQGKKLKATYGIRAFICDPSEPAYIVKFKANGLNAIEAENSIAPGISAMQERLKVAGDGRTRLCVYEHALRDRDELRENNKQPCCFEDEILEYVWPKQKDGQPVKEVPVKVNDHSLDAVRYLCKWLASGYHAGTLMAELSERKAARETVKEQLHKKMQEAYW